MGPQLLHVVSQTDMTMLTVALCNSFVNVPKKDADQNVICIP